MDCPFCGTEATPRALHSHLEAVHPEQVLVAESARGLVYKVTCPLCGAHHEQQVKGRAGTAAFALEHAREIRLVGFDMLVNHLVAEHAAGESTADTGPAVPEEER